MYFKVEVSSETGNKIAHLLERELDCLQASLKVAKKYGFNGVVSSDKHVAGGIKYFTHPTVGLSRVGHLFSPLPNSLKHWKPKRSTLAKVVRDDVDKLPTISMKEWNKTVLTHDYRMFERGKINFTQSGGFFLFFIDYPCNVWDVKPDCQQVYQEEVYELFSEEN